MALKFLEKDLEDIIFETSNEELSKRKLFIDGIKKRQVRIGNYGIADLISVSWRIRSEGELIDGTPFIYFRDSVLRITVYELKKDIISLSTFLQAVRYCRGIQRYLNNVKPDMNVEFSIVLIGKEIDNKNDFVYFPSIMAGDFRVNFYTYKYEFDGIKFEHHVGFKLSQEGF